MTNLERLASPDRDERYAACKALRDAAALDEAEVQALILALDDHAYGEELVPDHAGGGQYDPVEIAEVARQALAAHGVRLPQK